MVTTESADSVLKSYYLSAVAEQLNKSANPFLARIKQTTSDVWGKDVRKAVRYGMNGGIGAGTELGKLPHSSGNNYSQFVSTLKNLYGVIEISDKAIRASQNAAGAFVDLLNDEMDGLVKSSSYNFGRMLFGDGSGKVATIVSGKGAIFVVDSLRNLAVGMCVDVYNASGSLNTAGSRIVEINYDAKSVTLSGVNISAPEGYRLYVQSSKGLEITGLGAIFSENDIYGLTRDENLWMTPYIKDGAGNITEETIQEAMDEVEARSGSKTNFIICSWDVRRALVKLLSAHRVVDTLELEGGFRALSFNGIPVVADRFCPEGTMYLLNTDDFALHQLCDWQWLESENGSILKQVADKPVFTATLVKYAELLCYCPAGQAMISGITGAEVK